MKVGGLQEISLLDYPDHISAIVWTIGCNFRCPFCYNTELVKETANEIPINELLKFLNSRKGLLEAVVITGGEPLLQKDIQDFLIKIKKLGFLVKVDTNGMYPKRLENLIDHQLIDYVAMDIKAPPEKYALLSGCKVDIKKIEQSIKIIKDKAVDYEFRTTIIPKFLTKNDIQKIAEWLKNAKRYFLQQYKHNVPQLNMNNTDKSPYESTYLKEIRDSVAPFFQTCVIRGLR